MAEELEIPVATEPVEEQSQPKREDKRIKDLSGKVELTSKQRDEAIALAEKAQREAGFYKDFSGMISKYPHATEYQEKIKEKVMGGYTVEDATAAILVKEGKFMTSQPRENPAGGSSVNQPPKVKNASEMTQAERLEALKEAEKAGYIWLS